MKEVVARGIDVSKHNGAIDFQKVRASGIDYVVIRAGYGRSTSQKDLLFESHYQGAKAAGLDVGAYWYSYAMSVQEAVQEAKACIECIKGKRFEYPIYFDLEEQKQFNKGKAFCSDIVTAFCSELENAGYWTGLYISRSPLQTHISDRVAKRYALWVAEYNTTCKYTGSYGMWQRSATGRIAGINGDVDLDECYIHYPEEVKKACLNGYKNKQYRIISDALDESAAFRLYEIMKDHCSCRIEEA